MILIKNIFLLKEAFGRSSGFLGTMKRLKLCPICSSHYLPSVKKPLYNIEMRLFVIPQSFTSIRYPQPYPPAVRCHYQIQPGVNGPTSRGHQRKQRNTGRTKKERYGGLGGKDGPTTVLLTFDAFQVGTRVRIGT